MTDDNLTTTPGPNSGVYTHQFDEAHGLHHSAGQLQRFSNMPAPDGTDKAKWEQRRTILTIAFKLILLERNRLLDEFCADWLRFRNLPIPNYEPPSHVDLQRPSEADASVPGEVRKDSGGA